MNETITIRDFHASDATGVNRVALAAFDEYRGDFSDWAAHSASIARMASLADVGELIVAGAEGRIVGAVVYVPPGAPKASHFDVDWPIIRLLVVDPAHRGLGLGRALTEECVRRAVRDGSPVLALHTSPIMRVALPMYLRMGFALQREVAPINGVPYAVYLKRLAGSD